VSEQRLRQTAQPAELQALDDLDRQGWVAAAHPQRIAPSRAGASEKCSRAHIFAPVTKHGAKSRRKWRKLHLAVDAASGMIVAQTLTAQDADDPSQVAPLLDQIGGPIVRVTADGAYEACAAE